MVELQALALVNGKDADAVVYVALYRFAANGLVPLAHKGVDICGVILRKLVQLVVESTDVGTLLVQTLKVEDGV